MGDGKYEGGKTLRDGRTGRGSGASPRAEGPWCFRGDTRTNGGEGEN